MDGVILKIFITKKMPVFKECAGYQIVDTCTSLDMANGKKGENIIENDPQNKKTFKMYTTALYSYMGGLDESAALGFV